MAQHDYIVDNASGASVRSDINNALSAIVSLNSGASAPSTTYADMLWVDTTNGLIKRRNSANSGWIPIGPRSSTMVQAKTAGYTVALSDFGTLIDCTSGTFTLALTAAATLGDGFYFFVRNTGSGTITIDPNSSETIDGSTTIDIGTGEAVMVWCNATLFRTIGRSVASATQAQLETGTSLSAYVSPGRQHYHPIHPKFAGRWNGTTTGTFSPQYSFGISSVVRGTTGQLTVNLSGTFNGTYIVEAAAVSTNGTNLPIRTIPFSINSGGAIAYSAPGTTSFSLTTLNVTGNFVDCDYVHVIGYGDQA